MIVLIPCGDVDIGHVWIVVIDLRHHVLRVPLALSSNHCVVATRHYDVILRRLHVLAARVTPEVPVGVRHGYGGLQGRQAELPLDLLAQGHRRA